MDPPYLFLCMYHLPKRHMMDNFLPSFIDFLFSSYFAVFFVQIPNRDPPTGIKKGEAEGYKCHAETMMSTKS